MTDVTTRTCPYCKNPLNPGATACSACSARETTKWDAIGQARRVHHVSRACGGQ